MLREEWGTGRERNRRRIPTLKKRGRGTQIFLAAYVRATRPDPFVVALARCVNVSQASSLFEGNIECIVVTEEGGGAQQIPAACLAFGLKCVNLVGLIQREGWKF